MSFKSTSSISPSVTGTLITTQNQSDYPMEESYVIDNLPFEVFFKIICCFGVPNIQQVFQCSRVSHKWKLWIETDCDDIFQLAKVALKIKIVDQTSAKSLVSNCIKTLIGKAKLGDQKLSELTEKCYSTPEFIAYMKRDHTTRRINPFEGELDNLRIIRDGIEAHLRLLNVGKSTWDTVMKYPTLLLSQVNIDVAKDFKSLYPKIDHVIFKTTVVAAEFDHLDDLIAIINQLPYMLSTYMLHKILYHFYVNERFEKAERLCKECNVMDDMLAQAVFLICERLYESKPEIAKRIASTVLPPIEQKVIEMIGEEEEDETVNSGLDCLSSLFNWYLLDKDVQKVNAYLSEHPDFAHRILNLMENRDEMEDMEVVEKSTEEYLKMFIKAQGLKSQIEKGDESLRILDKKLNGGGGKRSYPFDKNPLDEESDHFQKVVAGLSATLEQLSFGNFRWEDVKKYISVVTAGSHARCSMQNDNHLIALHLTLLEALKRHLLDDAKVILKETRWDKRSLILVNYSIIEYHLWCNEFEKAEKFCIANGFNIVQWLFMSCCLTHPELGWNLIDSPDRFKLIVSNALPFLEKKVMELLTIAKRDQIVLKRLYELFSIYLFNDYDEKVKNYLSNHPELVTQLSELDIWIINSKLKSLLEEQRQLH